MQTITERFGRSLRAARSGCGSQPMPDDWQCTLKKFRVPDVSPRSRRAQAWLICESPHTGEVTGNTIAERYPLRGRSGKAVTEALIKCGLLDEQCGCPQGGYIPVGQLVHQGVLTSINIANVCELPLQSEAYAQHINQELVDCIPETLPFKEWAQILLALRTVRKLKVNSSRPTGQPLVCDVLDDFRARVRDEEEIGSRRILLCGKTAKACWRVLGLPCDNDHVRCIAHPSHQGWYENRRGNRRLKCSVRAGLCWLLQPCD